MPTSLAHGAVLGRGSPNVVTQSQPASSSKPTADFEVMEWNAVSLL
jgi:hypothetical protein